MDCNISDYIVITPRIVPSHAVSRITISTRQPFIELKGLYEISILPKYYYFSDDRTAAFGSFELEAADNCLQFDHCFEEEQEYVIAALPKTTEKHRAVIISAVYALDDDLRSAYPLKGELHMHTLYSDGVESPEHRVIAARKAGFDLIAVTDHNNFGGSLAALHLVKKAGWDMVALHGEEVHALNCPSHILSLGASRSIVPEVAAPSAQLEVRRAKLRAEYRDKLAENVSLESFVAAMDVFDRIRDAGGLSVLCHIYWDAIDWTCHRRLGAPQQLTDALVKHLNFDAFELTSGAPSNDLAANYLQAAYYRENLPAGFPIIGVTDSHTTLPAGGSIFGKNYTIVFAKERTEQGVIDAIRSFGSVCVDGVGSNAVLRGSVRLCKYARFLTERYYPTHDLLLAQEALAAEEMVAHRSTDNSELLRRIAFTRSETELLWAGLRI